MEKEGREIGEAKMSNSRMEIGTTERVMEDDVVGYNGSSNDYIDYLINVIGSVFLICMFIALVFFM